MKALIDGDVILYERASAAQYDDIGVRNFDWVQEKTDRLINAIMEEAGCSSCLIFFTGPNNFRISEAKTKPYKGNRKEVEKPFHYKNLKAYLKSEYQCYEVDNLEADDLMAMAQTKSPEATVICTRDKDLLQVHGWHYGWECHKQPERSLHKVDEFGRLVMKENKSVYGEGLMFFYFQLLCGDVVDNIQGVKGVGAATAYAKLKECETEAEMLDVCKQLYDEKGAGWEQLVEMSRLLWMVRGRNQDGSPIFKDCEWLDEK